MTAMHDPLVPLDATRRTERPAHTCHWPGCRRIVPPKMWGCQHHWFRLPAHLRTKIWGSYVPGQEITKKPSPEYVAVAKEVQAWIANQEKMK